MPKKIALVIGINYLSTNRPLKGGVNDAILIGELLRENGFEITIMIDTPTSILQPSRENIIRELEKLIARAEAGDTLFLHFSGHGYQLVDNLNPAAPHSAYGILPSSIYPLKDMIKAIELRNLLIRLPIGARFFALMDCCHSGSILKISPNLKQQLPPQQHGKLAMISGCEKRGTSVETQFNGQHYGALTRSFYQTIQGDLSTFFEIIFNGDETSLRQLQNKLLINLNGLPQRPNIARESIDERINLTTSPDDSPIMSTTMTVMLTPPLAQPTVSNLTSPKSQNIEASSLSPHYWVSQPYYSFYAPGYTLHYHPVAQQPMYFQAHSQMIAQSMPLPSASFSMHAPRPPLLFFYGHRPYTQANNNTAEPSDHGRMRLGGQRF